MVQPTENMYIYTWRIVTEKTEPGDAKKSKNSGSTRDKLLLAYNK